MAVHTAGRGGGLCAARRGGRVGLIRWSGAAACCAFLLLFAGQVIAAPAEVDHRGAVEASGWRSILSWDWTSWWPLLLAPVSLFIIGRSNVSLRQCPARPRLFTVEKALLLACAIFLLGALGAAIVRKMTGATPDTVHGIALIALGFYAAQCIGGTMYIRQALTVPPPSADRRRSGSRAAVLGVFAMLVWWPVVIAVGFVAAYVALKLGQEPNAIAHKTLEMLQSAPLDRWTLLMGAMVVLVTPVVEEIIYRGLIQSALRRIGMQPWPAITFTSGIFALMHIGGTEPHALLGLFVLSLAFGWALEKTGHLTAPIVMHAVFNLGNLLVARAMASHL